MSGKKIACFLQKFGAKDQFKLEFNPDFYGPYSGKVRHVLYYLNGSYVMGYSDKNKKPFEELELIPDAERDIDEFLNKDENLKYKLIPEKTKKFLKGFYSPFGLELLSTIDFIINEKNDYSRKTIQEELEKWGNRKKTLFDNPGFINIAVNNIQANLAL